MRGLTLERVEELIDEATDGRFIGFWGEPGVNVLELNLALDRETRALERTEASAEPVHARDRHAAIGDSFLKLDPRTLIRNPVIFIVEVGSVIVTANFVIDAVRGNEGQEPLWFTGTIAIWLWLTVLFANLAEAMAEGRGKAQASALRATRTTTVAHRRLANGVVEDVPAPDLSAVTSSSSPRAT